MRVIIPSRNQGGMLIITLGIAVIIGTGLVSYLLLVHSKNRLVSRSMHWNLAITHAEAGVEEALAQLNYRLGTNINRAANGWGGPVGGVYGPVTRNLRTGRYSVAISNDHPPTIYSIGFATNPISKSGDFVSRKVCVKTRFASAFQVGMAAKLNVTFKGNTVTIDSFDSADPAHDNPLDPNEVKAGGDVASTDGFVEVGNANIHGKIKTGPGGTYSFGPNGFAGPIGWNGPGLYGPDWYANDFNADFKDVDSPYPNGIAPPLAVLGGTGGTNKWEVTPGDWYVSGNFDMKNNENMYVVGNARLYVTGNFDMNNSAAITIAPGASLKIYLGQTSGSAVSAKFSKVNVPAGADAASFQFLGLPSNTSVTWGGNDAYKGTIYAPQATFTMGGGGSTIYDYQGACVVKDVVMNGHFRFHYDENLRKKDPTSNYVAGSWREL